MAQRFHIGQDGLPRVCRAQEGACPLGSENEHYSTKLEAIVAAERKLLAENEAFSTVTKGAAVYHLSERGAVEDCPFRDGRCPVRPYRKYANIHTRDKAEAESSARAFRELEAIQSPAPRPQSTRKNSADVSVASDPITNEARGLRGINPQSGATAREADRMRAEGWLDEEIQHYYDSCGHWKPERFMPKRSTDTCGGGWGSGPRC